MRQNDSWPQEVAAALTRGLEQHKAGNWLEAAHCYRRFLQHEPYNTDVLSNLGLVLSRSGQLDEAITCFSRAIAIEPDNAGLYNNLGNSYKAQGELEKARKSFSRALHLLPDFFMALCNLGVVLKELGDVEAAVEHYRAALTIQDDVPQLHNNLGNALADLNQTTAAISHLETAIALRPDYVEAISNLGNVFKEAGDNSSAMECYKKALAIDPGFTAAMRALGHSLIAVGELAAAIATLRQAIALEPDDAAAYNHLGQALADKGDFPQAIASFQEAIRIRDGNYPDAILNLSAIKKCQSFAEISILEKLLAKQSENNARANLNFALGKANVDLGRDAQGFKHYLTANRLVRKEIEFSIADEEKIFANLKTVFDHKFHRAQQGWGHPDKRPIFIIGLPRSGSTLVEQILASHNAVFGGGELTFIKDIFTEIVACDKAYDVASAIKGLSAAAAKAAGREYVARIGKIAADNPFVTDKMPSNFLFVGLIKLILPHARFIHTVRAPEDTCLSIFRARFTVMHEYAYDLEELGRYYRLYAGLMAHWHSLFPGAIFDIHYENLVENQRKETERLLDCLGLEWDAACMNFHRSSRNVQTASNFQVRQPMYSSSIGGWRRFEKELKPLLDALSDAGFANDERKS